MLNNISLMGRLTKEPELRYTEKQTPVTTFSIACDRDFVSGGGDKTDFFRCVSFQSTAEFVSKYFHKGMLVAVAGSLQVNKWKDKDDRTRETPEINVRSVYFGEPKGTLHPEGISAADFEELPPETGGELPF